MVGRLSVLCRSRDFIYLFKLFKGLKENCNQASCEQITGVYHMPVVKKYGHGELANSSGSKMLSLRKPGSSGLYLSVSLLVVALELSKLIIIRKCLDKISFPVFGPSTMGPQSQLC